jgi:hypothetical protein
MSYPLPTLAIFALTLTALLALYTRLVISPGLARWA